MLFTELAQERYSARSFKADPVEKEKIKKIIEAANSAPTATNAQPFHIWVIQEEKDIKKINETTACGFGANTFLVLGADTAHAWTREEDNHNFADVDAGIVGTHILFSVHEQGLGTTWVGRVDQAKLKEHFPDMNGYEIVGLFPVGYPSDTKAGQPGINHTKRKSLEEICSCQG